MKAYARLELPGTKWVVDCPHEHCRNAYQVWPGDPLRRLDMKPMRPGDPPQPYIATFRRRFKCGCTDTMVDLHEIPCGQVIDVVFPDDIDKGLAVLALRSPAVRAWMPGETVDELVAQNFKLGLAVP